MIRPHKILLIKKNFIEFSFDDEADSDDEFIPDFEKFQSLNSAEQYYLADIYNWDDGPIVLQWIVESPKCDKGTACMIFWRAEPGYYFDFSADTIGEYQKGVWDLLQKIITRFKANDFVQSKYEFLPDKEGFRTDWETAVGIWEIPQDLKDGIKGKKPSTYGF